MTRTYRHLVLHPLAVLLMLVAMVVATAADAATCGTEVAPIGSVEASAASFAEVEAAGHEERRDDPNAPADQHGICGHGHCHHSASVTGAMSMDRAPASAAIVVPASPIALSSDENARLRRPPRA